MMPKNDNAAQIDKRQGLRCLLASKAMVPELAEGRSVSAAVCKGA